MQVPPREKRAPELHLGRRLPPAKIQECQSILSPTVRTANKFSPVHPPLAATTPPHQPGRRQPVQRGNPSMPTRTLRTTDGNVAVRPSPCRRSTVPQNVNFLFNPNPRWLSRENCHLPMQTLPTAFRNAAGSLHPITGTATQWIVNNLPDQCHWRLPQQSTFWAHWAQA